MPPKELLILTVAIPIFLFLSTLYPQTQLILIVLWICSLIFDIYSTHQFYHEDPNHFQENEQNKIFSKLTKKIGFKKATIIFPITFEIPLMILFSFLLLQTLYTYMFPNAPNGLIACLTTNFGASGIGHLQAATKNTHYNNKQHMAQQKLAEAVEPQT